MLFAANNPAFSSKTQG